MNNINKYIITTAAAGTLLFSGLFVSAQYSANTGEVRPSVKNEVQQVREKTAADIQKMREGMQQKIAEIKDTRKMEAATKVASQLERVNTVWTGHFNNVLDHLSTVLEKVKSRVAKAAANGSDVTATNAALQKATDAIGAARIAVVAQAQKTYTVDTSTITGSTSTTTGQDNLVSKLRSQFKTLREQLFSDLMGLRDGVMKDARTSVKNALQVLQQVPDVDKEPATNTNK